MLPPLRGGTGSDGPRGIPPGQPSRDDEGVIQTRPILQNHRISGCMAESFARRMMAQRLMTDARATPFSDSAGFGGRSTPDSLIRAMPDAVDASLANEAADLGRVAYGGAAMGSLFLPGAGVTDVFGYAPDPFNQGEYLPSFGENISQGNYLDAGLQTLGVAGDVLQAGGAIVPPLAAVGTALKTPRAARVAASSAPALAPAIRGGGKVFKGGVGETHLDVLDAIEDKQLASRLLSDADNRGFVTEKGKFLSRDRAVDYALQNDLVDPDFASYYRPDQYSELIADHLKKPSSVDPNQAAGAAMDAAQARYFETGQFEPPTAENPVSVVRPTETEPGIIAFHGSGADFDEFRLEMIGTGEGAQAYGYGLYFTDSEDIAKFYRNSVGGANVLKTAQNIKIEAPSGGTETAANFTGFRNKFAEFYGEDAALFADRYLGQFTIDPDAPQDVLIERAKVLMANVKESDRIPENAEEIVSKITLPERGKVYKVGLSPKPDDLLDYDEFFGDQNPAIKKKLRDLVENELTEADAVNLGYEDLSLDRAKEFMLADDTKVDTFLGNWAAIRGKDNAGEELLNKYGIPGLKYRASGSRGAGVTDEAAERNYVIFDDKAVKILEKYGIAGPVLVTGAVVGASKAGNDNEDGGSILPDAGVL